MEQELTTYLASKGIQVNRANGAEVTFHCLWCPDGDPKGKGKCYANSESWLYDCKRCGTTGNRRTLLRHFGDEDEVVYIPGSDPAVRRKVLDEAVTVAQEMLENNDEMLEYLIGRGLKAATIREYRLGYVPANWSLCNSLPTQHTVADLISAGIKTTAGGDFFKDKLIIPYLSHGAVVQMRGKDPAGKYYTPAGENVRLFNADRLQGATDVIITEGEFDCLVLQQTLELSTEAKLRATAVVGIPGAGALPAGFESYFSEAKRVFIALDPDDTGKKAALKIKELLGSKARIVALPEDLPKCDWTEFLTTRGKKLADVRELLSTASGKRLWSVGDAGARWRKKKTDAPGIQTGFSELDAWFSPGMEPGDLIIPLAKTGVGKTNFLVNIAYATRLRPTLMVSLEMTAPQVYERLRKVYHFHWPEATDVQIDEAYGNLRIVDENKLAEGAITSLCEEYEEELGFAPQLVMVDYLGYYAKGCRGVGQYEKTTNAAMSLKAEAKGAEVALIAPHQVNRMAQDGKPIEASDARDSGAVEETADWLLSLYRPQEAIEKAAEAIPSGLVRIGNLKNRKGAKDQVCNVMFSAASLALVDANSPMARVAEEENRMVWRGCSYQEVRAMRLNDPSTRQLRLA